VSDSNEEEAVLNRTSQRSLWCHARDTFCFSVTNSFPYTLLAFSTQTTSIT